MRSIRSGLTVLRVTQDQCSVSACTVISSWDYKTTNRKLKLKPTQQSNTQARRDTRKSISLTNSNKRGESKVPGAEKDQKCVWSYSLHLLIKKTYL